jgi:hypothetical protein
LKDLCFFSIKKDSIDNPENFEISLISDISSKSDIIQNTGISSNAVNNVDALIGPIIFTTVVILWVTLVVNPYIVPAIVSYFIDNNKDDSSDTSSIDLSESSLSASEINSETDNLINSALNEVTEKTVTELIEKKISVGISDALEIKNILNDLINVVFDQEGTYQTSVDYFMLMISPEKILIYITGNGKLAS